MALWATAWRRVASLRAAARDARLGQDGRSDGEPTMRETSLLQQALGLTPPWTAFRAVSCR